MKSRICFLLRNKASFTHAAKHTLVKLTILPILDFGDVTDKIASKTLLNKLDAVYHSAIRFVPHSISTCTLIFCTSIHSSVLIAKYELFHHYGLFIALTPLSYLICIYCI
jgi:hypothetical protein